MPPLAASRAAVPPVAAIWTFPALMPATRIGAWRIKMTCASVPYLAKNFCSCAVQRTTVRAFMPAWAMTTFDGALAASTGRDRHAIANKQAKTMLAFMRLRIGFKRILHFLQALRVHERQEIAGNLI